MSRVGAEEGVTGIGGKKFIPATNPTLFLSNSMFFLEKQLISLQWFTIDLIGTYLAGFKMHFYFDLHSYIAF